MPAIAIISLSHVSGRAEGKIYFSPVFQLCLCDRGSAGTGHAEPVPAFPGVCVGLHIATADRKAFFFFLRKSKCVCEKQLEFTGKSQEKQEHRQGWEHALFWHCCGFCLSHTAQPGGLCSKDTQNQPGQVPHGQREAGQPQGGILQGISVPERIQVFNASVLRLCQGSFGLDIREKFFMERH